MLFELPWTFNTVTFLINNQLVILRFYKSNVITGMTYFIIPLFLVYLLKQQTSDQTKRRKIIKEEAPPLPHPVFFSISLKTRLLKSLMNRSHFFPFCCCRL
jgi:hypothetical protein